MKSEHPFGAMVACCVGFLFLATALWAQEGSNPGHGFPQDWSEHNILFSLDGLARVPNVINEEPRVQHQLMQRFRAPNSNPFRSVDAVSDTSSVITHQRDWSVSLGKGRLAANMFPAKFSFDPGAPPSCANDYVVYGLSTAGATGAQANLVAFNNLYSGTGGLCGAAPTVMFAYNITTSAGGKIVTSPVISADGKKIAFVESLGTSAVFHVLTWTAGQGGITTAAAPTAMTSLTYSAANTDTTSAPWVDYGSDTAYVGADHGVVYKITGVFRGTPALAGSPWPVTVASSFRISNPVLDSHLGLLMVGARNGNLYQINTTTGAIASIIIGAHGGVNPGVIAAPVVDVTNGTTFVVSANDGTSGVIVEVDTSTLIQLSKARVGIGAKSGTPLSILQPAFSNDYYTNPTTGTVHLCGTGAADTTPWQYSFGFTGRTMKTVPAFSHQLLTSTAATCSNWTEFFNPNINGGTDFYFFGLNQDCSGAFSSGCVVARTTDAAPLVTAPITGGPSGIVVDNYSTAGQASSIYFCAAKLNTAYKFTQNGLQ